MNEGIAAGGWFDKKPKGVGSDNMSCIIVQFKKGHADGA